MMTRRLLKICVIFVIVITLLSCARTGKDEVKNMDINEVRTRILAIDWDVLEELSAEDTSIVSELLKLAKHENPDVRELAVSSLGLFRGPEVANALADALNDPVGDVRVEAYNMLTMAHDPSILPKLQTILHTHEDEYVRQSVALTIGRIGDRSAVEHLKTVLTIENVSQVQSGIVQALARMGEDEAKKSILAELNSGNVKKQWHAMEKLEYVNDKALAVHLKAFLDNASPAFNINGDPKSRPIRIMDVALKTIAVLFEQPFTFTLESYRTCTDAELQEGRKFMQNQ
jgi:HEAT repeat protein